MCLSYLMYMHVVGNPHGVLHICSLIGCVISWL